MIGLWLDWHLFCETNCLATAGYNFSLVFNKFIIGIATHTQKSFTPLHPCNNTKVTGCQDWIETRICPKDWQNKLADCYILHKCWIILKQEQTYALRLCLGDMWGTVWLARASECCKAGCITHICILKAQHSTWLSSLVACNLAQFAWHHESIVMN